MSKYRKSEATEGPNDSGCYTAGIDALLPETPPCWHYHAVQFHHESKAIAESRRDIALAALQGVTYPELYWHEYNPWADSVVYVPIERLAECIAGGSISIPAEGRAVPYDVAYLLSQWGHGFRPLDAYILPQPHGRHSVGVRWGKEGSEYFSPHNAHPDKVQALLDEYRK